MHYYESRVLTSKDGLQLKSYANEHPDGFIIAKPKYVPTTMLSCDAFQKRSLFGKDVNRVNVWADKKKLTNYFETFKKVYPDYVHESDLHGTWFFGIPEDKIESAPDPHEGTKRLMTAHFQELDEYKQRVYLFIQLLLDSGLKESDIGLTNSTLLGNYTYGRSDMDLIIFGKDNYWKAINFLKTAKHPMLRAKTIDEWKKYFSTYNSGLNFTEKEFIRHAQRKPADGFFGETVYSLFGVEEPKDITVPWGSEKYTRKGLATIRANVVNDYHAAVRPGFYEVEDAKVIEGNKENVKIKKVVTYARDFLLQAFPGETILATGMLEEVEPVNGEKYHRLVVGYFDMYLSDRREQEFIKVENGFKQ